MGRRPLDTVCDLVMPDMDGYEVVNRLHAAAATKDATS